ncbi:hypothetical protein AB0A05_07445 [Streptomyces sp. NPDC046374]|uniref:hypothetical protein n=1 Tax=Streptomyces sp. NPDC046374 TaxID=3154917 RepID=UPI0033E90033
MTALKRLTNRTESAMEGAAQARARLTEALAKHGSQLDGIMGAVLAAEAEAAPWVKLARRIDRLGAREGLAAMRQEATETLLDYGIAMSTSLVTNAARLAEQDGLRRFLGATEHFEIDEDPAKPAEGEVVTVPSATEEERGALCVIRDTFVKRQGRKGREGWKYVTSVAGVSLGVSVGDLLIGQGWAEVDDSAALVDGQAVRLTATGRHILAA